MSSQDPEHRPGETSPLLGSNRSPSHHSDESPETTETTQTSQTPQDASEKEWLALWFWAALGSGILTAAFLFTEWLMAAYGYEWFWYHQWELQEFQEANFWVILVSIVFNIANLVRLRTTRKPLPILLNVVILGILTFAFIYGVTSLVSDLTWNIDYLCREKYGDHYKDREPPGSLEDCLKWAPKMKAVILLLAFFAGFHAMFLGRLLVAVLEDVFSITSRYFRGRNSSSPLGPGQITLQFSLGWGAPQQPTPAGQQNTIENQNRREPEVTV